MMSMFVSLNIKAICDSTAHDKFSAAHIPHKHNPYLPPWTNVIPTPKSGAYQYMKPDSNSNPIILKVLMPL